MAFIQIIEFRTSRFAEFESVVDEWLVESKDWRTATRSVRTKDRDNPDTYLQIVEFPSFEKAQENSNHPSTAKFAQRLSELCDGPPVFRNLDVTFEEKI